MARAAHWAGNGEFVMREVPGLGLAIPKSVLAQAIEVIQQAGFPRRVASFTGRLPRQFTADRALVGHLA